MDTKNIEVFTFEELKEIAKQQGIKPTKVSVGIWAYLNGYIKQRKQINKKRTNYYYKVNV